MTRARYNIFVIASLFLAAVIILMILGTGNTDQLRTSTNTLYETYVAPSRIMSATFDYKAAMAALNEARVDQEDPRLIKLIRDYYIDPPSDKRYNLTDPSVLDTSQGQSKYVDTRLNSTRDGFFIECGALDGDYLSNSLYFERARNWDGVLIEADPLSYKKLKQKNRKVHSINACLSPFSYPTMITFIQSGPGGQIQDDGEEKRSNQTDERTRIEVQCFPVTSILLALGRTTVDYFSLDIEGAELKVLKTIPMKKIDIKIMSVEVIENTPRARELTTFLTEVGYKKLTHMLAFYMSDSIYGKI